MKYTYCLLCCDVILDFRVIVGVVYFDCVVLVAGVVYFGCVVLVAGGVNLDCVGCCVVCLRTGGPRSPCSPGSPASPESP